VTFLADEGVDRQIVERLRQDGHEVAYVARCHRGSWTMLFESKSKLGERLDYRRQGFRRGSFFASGKPRPAFYSFD
jgi:hypothetical protein